MNQQTQDLLIVAAAAAALTSPLVIPRLRDWLSESDALLERLTADPDVEPDQTCRDCDGRGVVENDDPGAWWLTCRTCDGLGTVAAPDECGRCEGQGMFIAVVDGESRYVPCGWCAGIGLRGLR